MKYRNKIIILILTIFTLSICKLNSSQNEPYVNISDIKQKNFEGFVKQRPLDILCFQAEGKISFMPCKKGDFVKKGQVLARLDGLLYKIKKEKFKLNNEVNYNLIMAPYDGYIEKIYTPLNSYVKRNEPVISVSPTDKTQAETLVGAQYINKINLNNKAKIKYKNSIYEADISNISKDNDNYLLELKFDNFYRELREGSNVKVELDFN